PKTPGERPLASERVDGPEISAHQLEGTRFEGEQSYTLPIQLPREPLKTERASTFLPTRIDGRRNDNDVIHIELRDHRKRSVPRSPVLIAPVEFP
ncbi:hypothetical protein ACNJGE_21625, partial [Mycobacterium tuberculosis]